MARRVRSLLIIICVQFMMGVGNTTWISVAPQFTRSRTYQPHHRSPTPKCGSNTKRASTPTRESTSPFRKTPFGPPSRITMRPSQLAAIDARRSFYERLAEPRSRSPPNVRRHRIANRTPSSHQSSPRGRSPRILRTKDYSPPRPIHVDKNGLSSATQRSPANQWVTPVLDRTSIKARYAAHPVDLSMKLVNKD